MKFAIILAYISLFESFLVYFRIQALSLEDAVQKASGFYINNSKNSKAFENSEKIDAFSKIVVTTVVNSGYISHLYNYDCYMKRLGIKYLSVAVDIDAYDQIVSNARGLDNMIPYLLDGMSFNASANISDFRSTSFNVITARKLFVTMKIMELGFDVLFMDADVVMFSDPSPFLFWRNILYVHSLNVPCDSLDRLDAYFYNRRIEGNTGFYFVRSTNQTIQFWNDVYVAMQRSYRADDQIYFWKMLRGIMYKVIPRGYCSDLPDDFVLQNISICALDHCMFSSGMLSTTNKFDTLQKNLARSNQSMVTVHANYMKNSNNAKIQAIKDNNLWLHIGFANNGSHICKPLKLARGTYDRPT